ncbi:MAG TPA: endonuclease/exonuclease/phosphatase family protein [Candidatus Nitrosocosmicus sp.]|nr:endonuclease/exonuclease/phosphatase family protein [Candidatus Nitrosocosmicus sp.]
MLLLSNPPERHISTQHPYTQFITENTTLLNPSTTIHKEIYEYIHNTQESPDIQTIQQKFPYLPNTLIKEIMRINEPLEEYTHPLLTHKTQQPPQRQNTHISNPETKFITWNAASLNTALTNLEDLISHTKPAFITIQETKLIASKSTKYIQRMFPNYKLIFNNTHALTRCIQRRLPYTPGRGGLLTLINHKYAYPGNITKVSTSANISPYLQIIHIKNHPLQPWLLIHLYMPSHNEDIQLIPIIQQTITTQINAHPNHTHILCGDFNRDIALIGRQNTHSTSPPQEEDTSWRTYTENLTLKYI